MEANARPRFQRHDAATSRQRCRWAFAILICLIGFGCASHADRVRGPHDLFFAGQLEQAAVQLDKGLSRSKQDRDVVALDLAMVQLFSGQPDHAEQHLREVRDSFDHLEQKNLAEGALSYFLDDNHRAYAGEDYEKILIRVMLALTNLVRDGSDAEAYSLQVNAKQQEIVDQGVGLEDDNPKAAYQRVAIGAYLHGMLREATHANYDDAERAFATVVSWQPGFVPGPADLQRVREGRHSAPGNGVLYVFAFVGRGPHKEEFAEIPTSQAMLIADRIISIVGKQSIPPTLAPIKVPKVVTCLNRVDRVLVNVDGRTAGATDMLTDVSQMAVQQCEALYPYVLGRAVARRAIKKATIYAAKEQLDVGGGLSSLAMDAVGVAWEATESADTRCWGLLPDKIEVLRLELPRGQHEISLRPASHLTPLGRETTCHVTIEDGRNAYLLACCPDEQFVGRCLTSCP